MVQCIASLFLTGAAMSAATQEPPKSELPPLKAPFTERVKFEQYDTKTGKVEYTVENVDALFKGEKWNLRFGTKYVKTEPLVGSRFTTAGGDVWVIERAQLGTAGGQSAYRVTAKRQEAQPKKSSPKKLTAGPR